MSVSSRLSAFLMALLTILGCLVFLFSIILPFYNTLYFDAYNHGGFVYTLYYWSFKFDYRVWGGVARYSHVSSYWFLDYWFSENVFSLENSWMPIAMVAVQALVLAFGIASIHFKRRAMLAAPVCLSVAVIALMFYTGKILPYGEYSIGYYLVFPSLALFLSAFILNEVTKKQQTKNSISV